MMQAQENRDMSQELNHLVENANKIAEKTYEVMTEYMQHWQSGDSSMGWGDFSAMMNLYQSYLNSVWAQPGKLFEAQMSYWQDMMQLWQNTTLSWLGVNVDPVIQPEKGDRRFNDEKWDSLPIFAFIKQSYLIYAQHVQESVSEIEGLDHKQKHQLDFFTRQFVDALSPSNFIATNPQVLQKTLESQGENLLNGLDNMLADLSKSGHGTPSISMTDMDAFEVGKNIAVTPGSVVWQNDMLQLIQYTATTKEVYETPMMIIPPWINKYYILDLQPENSLVKYLTDQGFTTYVVSWVNPDERYRDKDFTSYMKEGALAAIDAICEMTGVESVNVTGYCIGGTLLSGTLAYLTAKKKVKKVNTATYLATMIDFSDPGDLAVFIDEEQVSMLEQRMAKQGYLDGASMSTTFNMLRSNELIWSYYINNYLLGQEPFPFDLLYWNCDNTNLPAAMHSFYLRKMYLENVFCQPHGVKLDDTPIDISQIKTPAYFLSAHADHIAPWQTTYNGALLHSGKVEFVLSGSGHIAGVVNPPTKNKYAYWTQTKLLDEPDEWLSSAKETAGSWWPHWAKWLAKQSGNKIPARKDGCGKFKVIEPAPGSYVNSKA